jgi:hypothetical protein
MSGPGWERPLGGGEKSGAQIRARPPGPTMHQADAAAAAASAAAEAAAAAVALPRCLAVNSDMLLAQPQCCCWFRSRCKGGWPLWFLAEHLETMRTGLAQQLVSGLALPLALQQQALPSGGGELDSP